MEGNEGMDRMMETRVTVTSSISLARIFFIVGISDCSSPLLRTANPANMIPLHTYFGVIGDLDRHRFFVQIRDRSPNP